MFLTKKLIVTFNNTTSLTTHNQEIIKQEIDGINCDIDIFDFNFNQYT